MALLNPSGRGVAIRSDLRALELEYRTRFVRRSVMPDPSVAAVGIMLELFGVPSGKPGKARFQADRVPVLLADSRDRLRGGERPGAGR